MSGADGVLILNVGVAVLFAAGYAVLALANPTQRAALGFAGGYLIGMVAPLADFAGPRIGALAAAEWASYVAFLLASLSIALTYPFFFHQKAPWRAAGAILIAGVIVRAVLPLEPQNTLIYGLAYQLPFTLAAVLAARTVLSMRVGVRALSLALGSVFALIAGSNLAKPLAAVALGSGRTLATYTQTAYAFVSQLSSGLLLLAAGMLLLIIVAQKAIGELQVASETDPLSGVLNRRGFDRRAREMVTAAQTRRRPLTAAMFDLDHFKHINDQYGHEVGDAVIAAAAAALQSGAPQGALVGRMGGEEFVLLLQDLSPFEAYRRVELLRASLSELQAGLPRVTASCGIAQMQPAEALSDLMRRADLAAYEAKRTGRNRLCQSGEGVGVVQVLNELGVH